MTLQIRGRSMQRRMGMRARRQWFTGHEKNTFWVAPYIQHFTRWYRACQGIPDVPPGPRQRERVQGHHDERVMQTGLGVPTRPSEQTCAMNPHCTLDNMPVYIDASR